MRISKLQSLRVFHWNTSLSFAAASNYVEKVRKMSIQLTIFDFHRPHLSSVLGRAVKPFLPPLMVKILIWALCVLYDVTILLFLNYWIAQWENEPK